MTELIREPALYLDGAWAITPWNLPERGCYVTPADDVLEAKAVRL